LSRLTSTNSKELLFQDTLWAARAREEHNCFAQVLLEQGVMVHYFDVLLAEALESPQARAFVLDRVCTPEAVGPELVSPLRELAESVDAAALAELLIGGVRRTDLSPPRARSLRWQSLGQGDFVLDPLPNTLFQRDNSSWIYGGVTINPMAKKARRRESLNSRAVYLFHPRFRAAPFPIYYGGGDVGHQPATLEGGDIHVLGRGVVLIGMTERSTPMAVEIVARELFRTRQASTVIAAQCPHPHASTHLDTILTMVDVDTFVLYPGLDPASLRTWTIREAKQRADQGTSSLHVEQEYDLFCTVREALGGDKIRVLASSDHPAENEQRDDANNYLALAPGVVVGYERNTMTNAMLRDHGITVISIPGSELGRGEGGARSVTCPIQRDGI
jgi:arginine deiminase